MKKQSIVLSCFLLFLLGSGCKNSQSSNDDKYQLERKEILIPQIQFRVQSNGEIAFIDNKGKFYYFDDEANYDSWVSHAFMALKVCEELQRYYEKKNKFCVFMDDKQLVKFQNQYINYLFFFPVKEQIKDIGVRDCLNKVYYEYKNAQFYRSSETGYGYKYYGLISLKSIRIKLSRQDDTGYLVIARCE